LSDNSLAELSKKRFDEELIDDEVYNPEYDGYLAIPDISEDEEVAILLTKLCHKPEKQTQVYGTNVKPCYKVVKNSF